MMFFFDCVRRLYGKEKKKPTQTPHECLIEPDYYVKDGFRQSENNTNNK